MSSHRADTTAMVDWRWTIQISIDLSGQHIESAQDDPL